MVVVEIDALPAHNQRKIGAGLIGHAKRCGLHAAFESQASRIRAGHGCWQGLYQG